MADIAEQICLAIDEIVSQRLRSIRADTTVIVTVLDNTDAAQGRYICSTGSASFVAYSTDASFKVGDTVQVTIPNGDYDEQKTIIGKYLSSEDSKPYIYESSFSHLVDATGNMIEDSASDYGLLANDETTEEILLWVQSYDTNDALIGYSRVGLQGQFKTLAELKNYAPVSGNYGYRLEIIANNSDTIEASNSIVENTQNAMGLYQAVINQDQNKVAAYAAKVPDAWWNAAEPYYKGIRNLFNKCLPSEEGSGSISEENYSLLRQLTRLLLAANTQFSQLKLNSTDMFGNPYAFTAYTEQERVFDISSLGTIYGCVLYFYQEAGTFKYEASSGELTEVPYKDIFGNLYRKNLLTKDPYVCFGFDVSEFDTEKIILYTVSGDTYSIKTQDKNTKTIRLRWLHEFDNGIRVVTKDTDLDYEVRWYRFAIGSPSADIYSGVQWKLIEVEDNKSFELAFEPDFNLQTDQVKAVLLYGGEVVRSNILTFSSEEEVPSQATIKAINGLTLYCEDGGNGDYYYYGQDGYLIETENISRNRVFDLTAYLLDLNNNETSLLTAESITWYFPASSTMLKLANETPEKEENGYYVISHTAGEDGTVNPTIEYKISNYFSSSYVNNTVKCVIVSDSREYSAVKEFSFGSVGTSGTDFTVVIDLDKVALTSNVGEELKATVQVYGTDYAIIDLQNKTYNNYGITWEWMDVGKATPSLNITNDTSITCTVTNNGNNLINANILPILKVTVIGCGDYDLVAYKPIPIRASDKYTSVVATTEVIYDSAGYSSYPSYYKAEHLIWYKGEDSTEQVLRTEWKIYNPLGEDETYLGSFKEKIEYEVNEDGSYELDENEEKIIKTKSYIFSPLSFYVEGTSQYGSQAIVNGNVAWIQPIITLQNHYPSAVVNEWNGKTLEIDKENNYILATAFAAGRKEADNSFSGVMLGNWYGQNVEDTITENTGIFGFNKGAQSFAFFGNGTAFIGKSGKGRIIFNGDKGTIQSQMWSAYKHGLFIDLDDGIIKIQHLLTYEEAKATQEDIDNNVAFYTRTADSYSSATDKEYDRSVSYYLLSNGVYSLITKGALEIVDGKITAKNVYTLEKGEGYALVSSPIVGKSYYKLSSSSDNRYVTLSVAESKYPLAIGKDETVAKRKFRVAWDGTCYITDGVFSGSIDAEDGYLGDLYVYGTIRLSTNGIIRAGKGSLTSTASGFYLSEEGFHIGNSKNLYYNNLNSSIFYNNGNKMKVTGNGIELFSANSASVAINEQDEGISFAQLGWDEGEYSYPYLRLGKGTSKEKIINAGIIKKYGRGIWIGNNDVDGSDERPTEGTGIFIDMTWESSENYNCGIYYSDTVGGSITKELGVAYFA